uniref:Uncharacterized protein n=1 Tax=Bursaphelenchus xylophilus TaxID=6326 RepID=A0A1I7RSC0_BURXY
MNRYWAREREEEEFYNNSKRAHPCLRCGWCRRRRVVCFDPNSLLRPLIEATYLSQSDRHKLNSKVKIK